MAPPVGEVLLIVDGVRPAGRRKEDDLPWSWHLDALVVACARAAAVHRLAVCMPLDGHFLPLVADVLMEYAGPREAEASEREHPDGRAASLRIVDLPGERRAPAGTRLRGFEIMVDLGVVHDSREPFRPHERVRCALVVGSGPRVRRAESSGVLRGLLVHRLLSGREQRSRDDASVGQSDMVASLEGELRELRGGIEHIHARRGEGDFSRERSPVEPPDFWRLPAYPLWAERMLAVQRGGHPRAG